MLLLLVVRVYVVILVVCGCVMVMHLRSFLSKYDDEFRPRTTW